jgi:hypothetical protein
MEPNKQDWNTIVIKKNKNKQDKEQKTIITNNPISAKITIDDEGQEVIKLKNVSHEMAQFIKENYPESDE